MFDGRWCDYLQELFAAGSDSVSISFHCHTLLAHRLLPLEMASLLSCLFLSLVIYPDVQKRAQAELDLVVGRDRLPTFDDRPRLPYIEAICREVTRWQMVTPIGSVFPYLMCKTGCETYCFQEFPTRQPRTMSTGDSSFQKV
jgi:Cytochrome P450